MFPSSDVRAESAPPLTGGARGFLRWVCTRNPFYVISAGLFLFGLWVSFGKQAQIEESWALMTGMAGYTLLLAVTACLLVRFGNVWDDVRTVLLLVVLMFLATSVLFDEMLFLRPELGRVLFLVGLGFAVVVSELLLRGMQLGLPAWYRLPYYLILALFFVYPLELRGLVDLNEPRSEALMWGLFGFSPVAGLVFLTLLPAIRRGPDYVADNGSPWTWPLYPWTLFGVLAFAVPGRAFLLCWSMQLLESADRDRLIFGPYFLVPFGLAIAVLLLEIGLVSNRRGAIWTALLMPVGLIALTLVGHRSDPIYQGMLRLFSERLGGDPLYVTLLAAAVFYAYAALRGVPLAAEALTAVAASLAVIGPDTINFGALTPAQPQPLLAAAALQIALGLWRNTSWRCLVGSALGVAALTLLIDPSPMRLPIVFHLGLAAILIIGAVFDDILARYLRAAGAALVVVASLAATPAPEQSVFPAWLFEVYPPLMAGLLVAYFWCLDHRLSLVMASLVAVCWGVDIGWRAYGALRQIVTGLDYLAVSLVLFLVAVLISLIKAGLLSRNVPPPVDFAIADPADAN